MCLAGGLFSFSIAAIKIIQDRSFALSPFKSEIRRSCYRSHSIPLDLALNKAIAYPAG